MPGTYRVRLQAGDWNAERTFELQPDPRVLNAGITPEDLQAQYALAREVNDLLTRARRLEERLLQDQKTYRNDTGRKDYLEAVGRALPKLQTEEGVIYPQPKLIGQIEYLAYMLRGADQRPGDDAYVRLRLLTEQFDALEDNIPEEKE